MSFAKSPTRLQWMLTYTVMLAAYATALNRETIVPRWARPEMYEFAAAGFYRLQQMEAGGRRAYDLIHEGIRGEPVLLLSDSQGIACNWRGADKLFESSGSPADLVPLFQEHVVETGTRYDTIVIWIGTAHFAADRGLESYLSGMDRLIEVVRGMASAIILVGPMPYTDLPRRDAATTAAYTHILVRDAVRGLQERHPDIPLYDMEAYREHVLSQRLRGCYQEDRVHITGRGYRVLADELASLGLVLRERS